LLPLTVDLVSFLLGVRQAFAGGDGVAFAQAFSFELDPMCTVNDTIEDRVAEGGIAEHLGMPQRLTGESLRYG
jgi:hypothetical protein